MVVIIPARNETATIAEVVQELKARVAEAEIVVVDDASNDDTRELARAAGATILPLPIRLGAWGATQTGMRYALRKGYDTMITIDADGQHPADRVSTLVAKLRQGDSDVVIGACTARGSHARRLVWWLFKRLTGLQIEDLTSGFRAYNHRAIQVLASPEATLLEYQDIGVLMLLRSSGLRISEVDVPMSTRQAGKSRIFHSWVAVTYYLMHTMVLCVTKWDTPTKSRLRSSSPSVRGNHD